MATILLKRGQAANIGKLTLAEGEAAIAYNEEKNSAKLYVGGGDGTPVLLTADVTAEMIPQDDTHQFVSAAEKSAWNSKLGANDTLDGGTF